MWLNCSVCFLIDLCAIVYYCVFLLQMQTDKNDPQYKLYNFEHPKPTLDCAHTAYYSSYQ